jgi:DNA helicase-2/ATP-dependent DNA helicase PcrA
VIGPPGTGKTTALLDEVERLLADGIEPARIAYLAFTRRAAEEALDRACQKFALTRDDLPFFRTIHSLAYRQLGLSPAQVLQTQHLREFADIMKVDITTGVDLDEGAQWGVALGDTLLFHEGLSRATGQSLRQVWRAQDATYSFSELERFARGLAIYKRTRHLLDFTDLLTEASRAGAWPDFDTVFVDEGQDLSRAQWRVLESLSESTGHLVIAGDDDQAIYRWAGADLATFTGLRGSKRVLAQSYRVPRCIQQLASSVIRRISGPRYHKEWAAREAEGRLTWAYHPEEADMRTGQWLVLARNNYMLRAIEDHCRQSGWLYSTKSQRDAGSGAAVQAWRRLQAGEAVSHADACLVYEMLPSGAGGVRRPGKSALLGADAPGATFSRQELADSFGLDSRDDWFAAFGRVPLIEREYLRACEHAGERLDLPPRIRLLTIHGSKGTEADNVLLLTDTSRKTHEAGVMAPDDETRTFYVAVTRAREQLVICEPQSRYAFQF